MADDLGRKGQPAVSNPRQDADAFDDLLGQLVDELAMTPTMPEPEPEPEPVFVPGGTTIIPWNARYGTRCCPTLAATVRAKHGGA